MGSRLSNIARRLIEDSDLLNTDRHDDEIRVRVENEIEDTEFRLKRGSELGRFDQFWDVFSIAGTLGRSGSISSNIMMHQLKSTRML
jgi:hypothetical protein